MWKACSPGGIPLSESLSSTPAGVCNRETVPTSWRFVSLSSALADWAAAGRTSALANKAITLMVRVHFRKFMPWSPRRQSVDSNYFLRRLPRSLVACFSCPAIQPAGWFKVRSARRHPIDPEGRNRRAPSPRNLCLGGFSPPLSLEELLPPPISARWAQKAPPHFSRRQLGCRSPYLPRRHSRSSLDRLT